MSKKKKKQRTAERRVEAQAQEEKHVVKAIPKTPLRTIVLFCVAVFLAGFLVYANTLKSDFIWDDEYLILNNSQIKSFSHLPNVFKTYVGYGSENINNFYRPMQEISNMVDFHFWGLKPFGFHLTNVVLHSLTSVMVMILIYTISGNAIAGLIAALFFAIHPVHSEAVAYIAGRADPLYSFFMLLSLVLFIRSVRDADRGPASHLLLYAASFVTFLISLLSKEMVMVMPLLTFLYMFYFFRGTDKNYLFRAHKWRCVPYAIVVVFYGYLRATVLSFKDIAPQSAFFQIPLPFRLLTFFRTVEQYFRLMVLPTDLHMERSLRVTVSLLDAEAMGALVMMAGIGWLAWWTYKKGFRTVSFAIVWFFVSLLPVSNIFPINSFIAEHWIYMACIGPLMLMGLGFAWLWHAIPPEGRSLRIGFILALAFPFWLYANLTVIRNADWKDEISFFTATLQYHPKDTRLYLNLGNTYYEKGDIDNAIKQYEKCIELSKDYAVAYGNIGSAYLNKGNAPKAEEYLKKAIELKDNYPIAHYNMGIILFQRKEYEKSLLELNKATDQLPQLYQAWNMKARAYIYTGKIPEARAAFERSLEIYPAQDAVRQSLEKMDSLAATRGAAQT